MDIQVKEQIPGIGNAKHIQDTLRKAGIQDVELFFDQQIRMWAVCQVYKNKGNFILPTNYFDGGVKPLIMWWCKNEIGAFRAPNDQDLLDILAVVKRAPKIWEAGGEARADKFDAVDAKKDEAHKQKLKDTVKQIAPAMKRAVQGKD